MPTSTKGSHDVSDGVNVVNASYAIKVQNALLQ